MDSSSERPPHRAVRRRSAALLAVLAPGLAAAGDPDAYDPLLDAPAPAAAPRRYEAQAPGGPGFFVGGGAFLYAGKVRSRLLKGDSGLETGAYPGILVTLGGRARIPLEVGFDIGYGVGARWHAELGDWVWAHDVLLEPRILWHVHETRTWDFVAGAAGTFWFFDVGADGISQTLMGPFAVLGVRRHMDARSLLFFELSGGYGKDTLAYRLVTPTAEDLAVDPEARPYRDTGAWYPLLRASAGYRLSGF
ncbi:hypothetical protein L6V77_16500 [Myxococcota bacterium]|nr:hypothetical protein [Myxococcota bacterium]